MEVARALPHSPEERMKKFEEQLVWERLNFNNLKFKIQINLTWKTKNNNNPA